MQDKDMFKIKKNLYEGITKDMGIVDVLEAKLDHLNELTSRRASA